MKGRSSNGQRRGATAEPVVASKSLLFLCSELSVAGNRQPRSPADDSLFHPVGERDLDKVAETCLPYLSAKQPEKLQEAARR